MFAAKSNPNADLVAEFLANGGKATKVPMTQGKTGLPKYLSLRSGNHIKSRRTNTETRVKQAIDSRDHRDRYSKSVKIILPDREALTEQTAAELVTIHNNLLEAAGLTEVKPLAPSAKKWAKGKILDAIFSVYDGLQA